MKTNKTFMYIAASLVLLVPVPARFGYGLLLILSLNLLMLSGTVFRKLLDTLRFDQLRPVLLLVFFMAAAVFFRQLLIFYSPVSVLTLGFSLYLPVVAVFLLGDFFADSSVSVSDFLAENMAECGKFSAYALLFFLCREVFGYGSVSFPVPSGIYRILLPAGNSFVPAVFWASIPGALVASGVLLAVMTLIRKKCMIVHRSAELQEEEVSDVD
ncbi:hypothetical protein [Treponema brennaborense]|uniref:Uncharacterized protein n=1 Tax=Treponema brennaborense (strain DSM 12168 / CIP 105900 / DD5/3) TaxID=906968 RepID=F4LMQ7_TREBD|nr:hypothetical protein [Treponema brennaborense]AEE16804.1 hypothetical protein Trebr_1380 [Treponema brennaborense DSM 12168]